MNFYVNRRNNNLDLFNEEDAFFANLFSGFSKDGKLLKTDIAETDKDYLVFIDVPGLTKKDVKISLEDKYLTVKIESVKEENEAMTFVRNERFYGTASRSFYVGDVEQKEINAKIDNGVLTITIPKKNYKKVEEEKFIDIQ